MSLCTNETDQYYKPRRTPRRLLPSTSYLTAANERSVFTSGGLPPLAEPDVVYEKLFGRLNPKAFNASQRETGKVKERNEAYYRKYPEDIQRVKDIIRYLESEKIMLPSGGTLSVLRFRQLGMHFGAHG